MYQEYFDHSTKEFVICDLHGQVLGRLAQSGFGTVLRTNVADVFGESLASYVVKISDMTTAERIAFALGIDAYPI